MERSEHQPGGVAGSGSAAGSAGMASGAHGSSARTSETPAGMADDARSRVQEGAAGGRQTSPAGQVRDKATEIKTTVADKLESGADRLRQRTREGAQRVASATAEAGAAATQRLEDYSDTVATRMERTAGWLRRGEIGDLGDTIVQQVQEHPARSLLIAASVGYLLGRLFKD
jgi:ElaB/YqjD/DUF883 family membrane-anchored ribosome-binding protein